MGEDGWFDRLHLAVFAVAVAVTAASAWPALAQPGTGGSLTDIDALFDAILARISHTGF